MVIIMEQTMAEAIGKFFFQMAGFGGQIMMVINC